LSDDIPHLLPLLVFISGRFSVVLCQGECGSCWAFSATGAIEGLVFIQTKQLISVSEQQVVDCDTTAFGCDGGFMDNAFSYVMNNSGICSEAAYPYTGLDGTCAATTCTPVSTITNYTDIVFDYNDPTNETELMKAVLHQPVSIAIEADSAVFQNYKSGVITDPGCGRNLDHGVLIVGFGTTENGTNFWIVKNSWGLDWGDNGYVLLQRDANQCGLNQAPSFPI
jgi:C1A family cysteine protease